MLERSRCRDRRGHHPWRFVGLFPDWTIQWRNDLDDGRWGLTLHREKKILIAEGLDQAERRSTICHEAGHLVRGPFSVCQALREESLVERQASRLLLPSVRRIGNALAWHRGDYERAAECLWVDEQLLNVRLSTLPPRDRGWLTEQMDTILL